MKFILTNVYHEFEKEIEINSLEELKNLSQRLSKYNNDTDYNWDPPYEIIINFEEMKIIIYDNYLE